MKKQVACFRFFCYIISVIQIPFVYLRSGHSPRFSQSYENVISCQDSGGWKTAGLQFIIGILYLSLSFRDMCAGVRTVAVRAGTACHFALYLFQKLFDNPVRKSEKFANDFSHLLHSLCFTVSPAIYFPA